MVRGMIENALIAALIAALAYAASKAGLHYERNRWLTEVRGANDTAVLGSHGDRLFRDRLVQTKWRVETEGWK